MKIFLLSIIMFANCFFVNAQKNDWLKGAWYGIRTFPGGHSTIGVPVRFEVDSVFKNKFSAKFIYMFPSDTSSRLILQINGSIISNQVKALSSKEIYLEHRRLRSFWSDCSDCKQKITYKLSDTKLDMSITYSGCGDSCNGEAVFSRRLSDYDELTLARVTQLFGEKKMTVLPGKNKLKMSSGKADKTTAKSKSTVIQTVKVKQLSSKILNTDTAKTNVTTKQKDSVYAAKKTAVKYNKPARQDTAIALTENKEKREQKMTKDSANMQVTKSADTAKDTIPAAIIQRDTKLITTYQVSSPHINVQLFDNGEIDYDAVSVYYNGRLIINNQTLTHKAINFSIDASAVNRHHEFFLIAETEGMIPPNTALMRITAGNQHYELEVSSNTKRNAKIAIDYTGN